MPDEATQTLDPDLAELDFEGQAAAEAAAESGATPEAASGGEQPAEPAAEEQAWWTKYGATEAEALSALEHVDTLRGRQANELGELRSEIEQLRSQFQSAQAPAPAAPETDVAAAVAELFEPAELADYQRWAEDDPDAAEAAIRRDLAQRQRIADLERTTAQIQHDTVAQRQVERATAELGDQWTPEVRQAVADKVLRDPAYFDVDENLQYERLRDTAELELRRQGAWKGQPASPTVTGQGPAGERTVHVEGGSGPQPTAAASNVDPVIAEMDEAAGRRDAFGALPQR